MKDLSKTLFAAALVMALSSMTYAQAGGSAGGSATSGIGAGTMKTPNVRGSGSADVTDTGVDAASDNPTTKRSNNSKTNGLNKGTHSGANSDVNSGISGSKRNGQ